MATKNKRSLEDGYDAYNPAPFVEHNPTFKYYADNINPIYVDNNTGEVWQNNKPKGSVVLPDIEVKGKNLKAIESGKNIRQEKGLENPMIDPFLLALGVGKYSGDIIGDLVGECLSYAARPLTKIAANEVKNFGNYLRGHVYYNVPPIGYDYPVQRAKAILKGVASGKKADIENAPWIENLNWVDLAEEYGIPAEYFKQARIDAWRMYNRLPQKYNTFIPSNTVLGAYQPNLRAIKDNPNIDRLLRYNIKYPGGVDIVNGSGGNVGSVTLDNFFGDVNDILKPYSGVMKYEDVWDLHPFSRKGDGFTNKVIRPLTLNVANKLSKGVTSIGNKLYWLSMIDKQKTKAFREAIKRGEQDALDAYYDSGEDVIYKLDTPRLADFIHNAKNKTEEAIYKGELKLTKSFPFRKLDEKMKSFEVGSITGGKPFTVVTEIPFHRPGGLELINGTLSPSELKFGFNPEAIATSAQKNWERTVGRGLYIKRNGGIHIASSKRGTFTAAATKHGMGVQEFASKVLRNKDSYSPAMVKKANFARNASKWNK